MTKKNLAVVLYGINDLRVEQFQIEEPEDDEVLLKMGCVGICGSDIHFLTDGRIGDTAVSKPLIFGHEGAGTVCKLGKNVKNLKIGDRVAIEPGMSCRKCEFCKQGRYHLCRVMIFSSSPPHHGSLRKYYKHAADLCFKLPDNMSMEEGALVEPMAVAVHACKRGNVSISSNVLIIGAGPIGLTSLLVARAMGAQIIVSVDLRQDRLDHAKKLRADATFCIDPNGNEQEDVNKIHKLFGDKQPDVTIDASGAEATIRLAIFSTKTGGTAVIVGMGPDECKLPIISALRREVDIKGVFRYANAYPDAMALISKKNVNVKSIITHRYKLEEAVKAFETSRLNKSAIKVMIKINE